MKPIAMPFRLFVFVAVVVILFGCSATVDPMIDSSLSTAYRSNRNDTNQSVINVSTLDKSPRKIYMANPIYPLEAKRAGIEGVVVVQFIITSYGEVINAEAIQSPHKLLSEAAVDAIMRSKFSPGRKDGRDVNALLRIPLTFRLN